MISRPEAHWREWGIAEWNAALFLHFFDATVTSTSVSTLFVTPETLAAVTGDPEAEPEEAKRKFLEVVGADPRVIRHHLSPARSRNGFLWLTQEPPQFFPFLILTCLVASTSDGNVGEIGGFRDRLRALLGHAEGVSYNLDGLNDTWRLLGIWLDHYREIGFLYRALVLPSQSDLGREIWIGISKRLAFPERRDMKRLIALLACPHLGKDPNPFDVIRAITINRDEFSLMFLSEFDWFREGFFARREGIGATPFWAAVREAIKIGFPIRLGSPPPKFGVVLFESETGIGEDMFLMSDQPLSFMIDGKGFRFVSSRNNASTFQFVAVPEDPEAPISDITKSLMNGDLVRVLPSFSRSPLAISLAFGVLLFEKNAGWFESSVGRPREGLLKVFVCGNLLRYFREAFPPGQCPQFHEELRCPSWFVSEPFDAGLLERMQISEDSLFARLRCFQPPTDASTAHLHGGIRMEDKVYLGMPPCLPEIHAPGANSVEVKRSGGGGLEEIDIRVKRKGGSEGTFVIVVPPDTAIEGEFIFVACYGDNTCEVIHVAFASKATLSDFKMPTSSEKWFVEAMGPAVTTYRPEAYGWFGYEETRPSQSGVGYPRPRKLTHYLSETYDSDEVYDSPAGAFLEICAAKAARKKGISEAEFLDLIQRVLPNSTSPWDLARAWTENCYFDRLTDRTWRVGCYFPVLPHLVFRKVGGTAKVTLLGLTPKDIRCFFSKSMESVGAHIERKKSPSPFLPAPLEWSIDDVSVVSQIAKEIKFPEPINYQDLPDTGWSIDQLLGTGGEQPGGYSTSGVWDWDKGFFIEFGHFCLTETAVTLERMSRNRRDLPDYYRISWGEQHVWWTYSRVWALLVAYNLRGEAPFALGGSTDLIGIGRPRLNIPLGHARRLCVTSSIVPGPFIATQGSEAYLYSFPSEGDRNRFLQSMWGVSRANAEIVERGFERILSEARLSKRRGERMVPLPLDLRTILTSLNSIPSAEEISVGRFSARIIAMIRAMVQEFNLMRGING